MSAPASPSSSVNPPYPPEALLDCDLNMMLKKFPEAFDHVFDHLGMETSTCFDWDSRRWTELVDEKFAADMEEKREGWDTLLLERKEGGGRLSTKERDVLQRLANIIFIPIVVVQDVTLWNFRQPEADAEGIWPDFTHQLKYEFWYEDFDEFLCWFDETMNERTPPLGHEPGSPSSSGRFPSPKDHPDESVSKDITLGEDL